MPCSQQFGLYCSTSALIDAVHQLRGEEKARKLSSTIDGPQFYASLRPLGNLFEKYGVHRRVMKFPKAAVPGIERSDPVKAIE